MEACHLDKWLQIKMLLMAQMNVTKYYFIKKIVYFGHNNHNQTRTGAPDKNTIQSQEK